MNGRIGKNGREGKSGKGKVIVMDVIRKMIGRLEEGRKKKMLRRLWKMLMKWVLEENGRKEG